MSRAQFFTNAIDTKTTGADFKLDYRVNLKSVNILLSVASNINHTTVKRNHNNQPNIKTPSQLQGFESVLFNREEVSRFEIGQPRSKTIFRSVLKRKKLECSIATILFGKVKYVHPHDGIESNWIRNELTGNIESRDQVFQPKWITDFSMKYNLGTRMSITVGGNNIFNVYPDRHQHSANISDGLFVYSRRVQQFGVKGTYWFSKINFRF